MAMSYLLMLHHLPTNKLTAQKLKKRWWETWKSKINIYVFNLSLLKGTERARTDLQWKYYFVHLKSNISKSVLGIKGNCVGNTLQIIASRHPAKSD